MMVITNNKSGVKIQVEINYYTGKQLNTKEFCKMWQPIIDYYCKNAENDMMIVLMDETTILAGKIINGKPQEKPDLVKIYRETEGKIFPLRNKTC